MINDDLNITLQAVQLLVCDWLLTTRTEVWEQEKNDSGDFYSTTVSNKELAAFHQDLGSLRKVCQHLKAALPRVFLHEATSRSMAGASPAKTRQLLHKSLRRRHIGKGLDSSERGNCHRSI